MCECVCKHMHILDRGVHDRDRERSVHERVGHVCACTVRMCITSVVSERKKERESTEQLLYCF